MESKLTKEEADAMLKHIEDLLGKRLLTAQEAEIFRKGVKWGGYFVIVVKATPRFVIGAATFAAACAALINYWPKGG